MLLYAYTVEHLFTYSKKKLIVSFRLEKLGKLDAGTRKQGTFMFP